MRLLDVRVRKVQAVVALCIPGHHPIDEIRVISGSALHLLVRLEQFHDLPREVAHVVLEPPSLGLDI